MLKAGQRQAPAQHFLSASHHFIMAAFASKGRSKDFLPPTLQPSPANPAVQQSFSYWLPALTAGISKPKKNKRVVIDKGTCCAKMLGQGPNSSFGFRQTIKTPKLMFNRFYSEDKSRTKQTEQRYSYNPSQSAKNPLLSGRLWF